MFEGKSTKEGPNHTAAGYSYPGDLARFVLDRWGDAPSPDAEALEGFFAACYQASMLREEERPVVFRVISPSLRSSTPGGDRPRACSDSRFPAPCPSIRGNSGGSRWPPTRAGR